MSVYTKTCSSKDMVVESEKPKEAGFSTTILKKSSTISWQIDGETMKRVRDYFGGAPKSLQMVTAAMKLREACSLEEKL